MDVSYKFRNLEKNLMKLIYTIAYNKNIKRYIKYLDNDPLDKNKPDISESLILKNIFPIPFNKTVLDNSQVVIFIYLASGDIKSKPTGNYIFIIDILCPFDFWILENKGKIRPISIAEEISKNIDSKNIAGVGEVNIENVKSGKFNDNYGYFTLFVNIESVTLKGKDK